MSQVQRVARAQPCRFLRLRLVLVKASKILSARSHVPHLKRLVQEEYDTRHRLTLPDQRTSEHMLWGYAIDKQHRVMAWLGPAYSSEDPLALEVRHWKSGTPMHTIPLSGMHFFDAWRIRPSLQPELPSLGKEELIPQEPPNAAAPQSTPAPTAHGGKAMEVDAQGSTSQNSGAPFPHPFTDTPQPGGSQRGFRGV